MNLNTFFVNAGSNISVVDSGGFEYYGKPVTCIEVSGVGTAFSAVVFYTKTLEVLEYNVFDIENRRAYRLFAGKKAQQASNDDVAFDDVEFINIDDSEDFWDKHNAIMAGVKDYDTRVNIPLEMDQTELYQLMLEAHKQDITLNQLVINLISSVAQR